MSWLLLGVVYIPVRIAKIIEETFAARRADAAAYRKNEWEKQQAEIARAERRQRYYDGLGG
ncbi:hypothetical protein SEA_ZIPP_19 [Gordonia phage Zipp]|uniref:Uncharacterized protein n=1 Tax=Gordonia phage Zipp TaxID=2591212 RepID=A0A514DHU2_9CAUD|nr:hypothetical protein J1775_gp19 [Gordonia phage Zipp]QDH93173.1 hypothetical protein SEA_ZIPP_19 [Gordonia phage Zipp]